MSIVWIDGVKTDNVEKAKRRAKTMDDARFQHFYDPNRLAGKAIAKMWGGGEGKIAWDIYLFFDRNSRWMNQRPTPLSYMHQLLPEYVAWADPEHYRCGDQLVTTLLVGLAKQRLLTTFQRSTAWIKHASGTSATGSPKSMGWSSACLMTYARSINDSASTWPRATATAPGASRSQLDL